MAAVDPARRRWLLPAAGTDLGLARGTCLRGPVQRQRPREDAPGDRRSRPDLRPPDCRRSPREHFLETSARWPDLLPRYERCTAAAVLGRRPNAGPGPAADIESETERPGTAGPGEAHPAEPATLEAGREPILMQRIIRRLVEAEASRGPRSGAPDRRSRRAAPRRPASRPRVIAPPAGAQVRRPFRVRGEGTSRCRWNHLPCVLPRDGRTSRTSGHQPAASPSRPPRGPRPRGPATPPAPTARRGGR